MENDILVEVDPRGRVTLGRVASPGKYLAHTAPDGTVTLEPAVVMTKTQQWFLESGQADALDRIMDNVEENTVTVERRPNHGAAGVA